MGFKPGESDGSPHIAHQLLIPGRIPGTRAIYANIHAVPSSSKAGGLSPAIVVGREPDLQTFTGCIYYRVNKTLMDYFKNHHN
jgi:hypothetical protein